MEMTRKCASAASGGKRAKSDRNRQPAGEDGKAQLVLDRAELVAMMHDCLTNFATEVGLKIACRLLEEEAESLGAPAET
jgi:hypothetical protein